MKCVIALFVSCVYALSPPLQTTMKNCRILINEWNVDTNDPEQQFLELKAYCFQTPKIISRIDMSRYRLLVINPRREVMVSCHTVAKKPFKSKTEFYFTYGGTGVAKADMNFSDCQIESFLRSDKNIYLPTGMTYPFGIMLVYNQRVDNLNITDLEIEDGTLRSKLLSDAEFSKLAMWVQDFYIYGSSTPFVTCDVFKTILSRYTDFTSTIVRDWQCSNAAEDYSVNRCTPLENTTPFQPGKIAYSVPTPGDPNDCSCGFQFFIENVLQSLAEPQKVQIHMVGGHTYCYKISEDADVTISSDETFEMEIEQAADGDTAAELMDVNTACADEPSCPVPQRREIGHVDIDISRIPNSANKFIWDNCEPFPQIWMTSLEHDPDKPLDVSVLRRPDVCYWYEYLLDEKLGRCKFCNALLEQGIVYMSRLDRIMREGYLYRTNTKNKKNINSRKILHHIDTDLHKISPQYFGHLDMGLRGENLTDAMMLPDGAYYKFYSPTENLTRINSWCLNHRTELVSKNSLRNRPLVKHIESKINALATFFGPISPKKRRVLEAIAVQKGYRAFTIHRIHDIRWSESKRRAMDVVFTKWDVIVDALKKISITNTCNVKTRSSAKELLRSFTDGTYMATLAFLLDITSLSSTVSETLQTRGSSLIGKRRLIMGLRSKVETLKTEFGPSLSILLQNSAIRLKNIRRTPTLSEFESSTVSYSGHTLTPSGLYNSSHYLHANRDDYVSAYTEKIDFYFPRKKSQNFDIFDPIEIESNVESINFGDAEITAMNNEYRWQYDLQALLSAWRTLRTNVVLHAEFPQAATHNPEDFWAFYLDFEDNVIGWTALTRSLIRRVISVSASSSEAERVFSVASAQKTKRRYNLKVETVNALVAIRLNGVKDLRKLDSFRYAKEFTREHSRADDATRRGSSSGIDEDEDFFLVPFDPDYEFA